MSTALPPPWQRVLKTPFRELVSEGPTGSLDWRVTLVKADAPEPIATVIGEVVRKTGLWNNEKRDVTVELLAHFQDGLDSGNDTNATAEGLVESFGDPAVAAKLIRRAKKRCRPIGWHAWWWATRGALLLGVLYLAYGIFLMTGRPIVSKDYLKVLNSVALESTEEPIGWPLYREALATLQQRANEQAGWPAKRGVPRPSRWGSEHHEWLGKSYSQLTPAMQETVDTWLDDHPAELGLFRRAASHARMGLAMAQKADLSEDYRELFQVGEPSEADANNDLFQILLPHVQESRAIAQVLFTDLTRAAVRGESVAAFDDLRAIFGVARHAGEGRCVVASLVGGAVQVIAIDAIREVLRDYPDLWSDQQLQEIAHDLARPPRPLRFYYEGELAMGLDFIQRVYSHRGDLTLEGIRRLDIWSESENRGIRFLSSPDAGPSRLLRLGQYLALPAYAIGMAGREETTRVFTSIIDAAIHDAELPLWKSEKLKTADDEPWIHKRRNLVAHLLAPASVSARSSHERFEGRQQGALIGIALELERRERGEWPDSLDGLSPRYLPALPVDPITGRQLGYKLLKGQPVVYSLGVDGDDDGGALPAACDPDAMRNQGYAWRSGYRPGAPIDREMTEDSAFWEDGDWVLWSLAEPRYLPDPQAQPEADSE